MIAVPRRFILVMSGVALVFIVPFAFVQLRAQSSTMPPVVGLLLFVAAYVLVALDSDPRRLPRWKAAFAAIVGVAAPLLATAALDPARETYSSGGWYVTAVGCLALLLHWRRREPIAWLLVAALLVHTVVWAGPTGLDRFSVVATILIIAVLAGGGWALQRTATDMERYEAAERTALEYRAAQDAYHRERQVRLATTGRMAVPMLQRIADAGGRMDPADRAECRVLEETIRDEIRGRRLLNDDLRDQIIAHRRNGAVVQVNDDGGLDDLDPALIGPMLTTIATAITGLHSDRIIIRTAPKDSPKALSVVAMSVDPIAAALGLDDGDDHVDLWLELDRPVAVARA